MEPLKDQLFNSNFYESLSTQLYELRPEINKKDFHQACVNNLDNLELMDRLYQVSDALYEFLPKGFNESVEVINELGARIDNSFAGMAFCDFVAKHGQDHFDLSMQSLKHLTKFSSAEFAIRPFLKNDFEKTIKVMVQWSQDENVHVRRLASEGSRPRLPWSFKLQKVIYDPRSTANILENLKEDNELYVKKSVGNHLNDISKDHPDYVVTKANEWGKKNSNTSWILKRAMRSMIKKGDKPTLEFWGLGASPKLSRIDFSLDKDSIKIGDSVLMCLDFVTKEPQSIALDFKVYYRKKNDVLSPKVFKWKELSTAVDEVNSLTKKISFADLSTRKHYAGVHKVEVVMNGEVVANQELIIS